MSTPTYWHDTLPKTPAPLFSSYLDLPGDIATKSRARIPRLALILSTASRLSRRPKPPHPTPTCSRTMPRCVPPLIFPACCSFQVKIYFALMHLHPLDARITYRATPGSEVQDAEELTLSTIAQLDDARYTPFSAYTIILNFASIHLAHV